MASITSTASPTTITQCTVSRIAAPSTSTHTNSSVSGGVLFPTVVIERAIPFSSTSCLDHTQGCQFTLDPNPDIAGLGVIIAFLIACYTVLILLLCAYWGKLLPSSLLARPDRALFHSGAARPEHPGRKLIEEVTLIFADQQLITGLGIIIAGYVQAQMYDLGVYHWNCVIYLAWLSGTVHLMSLSLLRDRLRQDKKLLTNIRLSAMLILFALLVVGLAPTTTTYWPLAVAGSASDNDTPADPGFPVRCFWALDKSPRLLWSGGESALTYLSLVGSYVWNLGRFVESSRRWIRLWARTKLETAMEAAMRQQVCRKPFGWSAWFKYRLIMQFYFAFVVLWEVAESFMATICILVFVLLWGSMRLLAPVLHAPIDVRVAERQMGFGQILPLLLLLQPALAMVAFWAEKDKTLQADSIADSPDLPPLQYPPTAYKTLRAALLSEGTPFLSSEMKATGGSHDPVITHLYRSFVFKAFVCWVYVTLLAILGAMLVIPGRRLIVLYATITLLAISLPGAIACLACSKKLR